MKIDIKKYLPIILILVIIGCGVAGYFLVWPKYQEFDNLKKEFEIKDEQLKEKQNYNSELDILAESLKQHSEKIAKINTALPDQPSVAALYYFIKELDSETGLDFEDINISTLFASKKQTSTGRSYDDMSFSVSMSGSYSEFKTFLKSLYLNSRIVEIQSLKFSQYPEIRNRYMLDLDLNTHKFNPNVAQDVDDYQQNEAR